MEAPAGDEPAADGPGADDPAGRSTRPAYVHAFPPTAGHRMSVLGSARTPPLPDPYQLRWLPTPAHPGHRLLAVSRGLSPTEIGLIFSLHRLVVLFLEPLTGGLSDSPGDACAHCRELVGLGALARCTSPTRSRCSPA
jgi:hypothetical protein